MTNDFLCRARLSGDARTYDGCTDLIFRHTHASGVRRRVEVVRCW